MPFYRHSEIQNNVCTLDYKQKKNIFNSKHEIIPMLNDLVNSVTLDKCAGSGKGKGYQFTHFYLKGNIKRKIHLKY